MRKEMDPDEIRRLIDGVPDVITPALEDDAKYYASLRCPVCRGGNIEKVPRAGKIAETPHGPEVVRSPWTGANVLPDGNAKCLDCSTVFDPSTSTIHSTEASMIHAPPLGPLQG